jgi:hypothetical protein
LQPADNEIAVTPASLLTHAGQIESAADGVEVVEAAAACIRLDSGAYGMVCAFVPAYLNRLSDGLMAGLDGALTSLRDTGSRLRATAVLFEEANTGAAQQLNAPLDGSDPSETTGYFDRTSLLDPTAHNR